MLATAFIGIRLRRNFIFLPICFLGLLATMNGKAQGFLHADNGRIVDGAGKNVLLRGIGLGGWMLQEGYMLRVSGIGQQQHSIKAHLAEIVGPERTEQFYDVWLSNHTTRKDIEALKKWGFNSVRLPMHYNLYTLPIEKEPVPGQNTWLEKGFQVTDSLLAWCKDNGIYLILDMHAAPGGQGHDLNISDADTSKPFLWESDANMEKMVALWQKLADRYKDEPMVAAYDIINEPNWGFADKADKNGLQEQGNGPLRQLMVDITKAIRSVDQQHLIIIEGNGWGNNYNGLLPPWDNNMALSFHKYWNYNDQASIQRFIDIRTQYNVPIWLGESGENSNVWFTQAISLMERNNIGWCWWPLKKIGINNPLEIKSNTNYDAILDYWNGKAAKPNADSAFAGLMALTNATNFSQNVVHRDVLDAMFRQVADGKPLAFSENIVKPGAVLPASHYDLGSSSMAYLDNDSADYHISNQQRGGNRGRAYRNDGVDIYHTADGLVMQHIEDGEWLQYTINVAQAGQYKLEYAVEAEKSGGSIATNLPNFAATVMVPATGKGKWKSVETAPMTLQTGVQVLKIKFPKGGFSLKEIRFVKAG